MSLDLRAFVARYIDAYNAADWDTIRELVSPDYVHHSGEQTFDFAGFVGGATWLRDGMPDLRVEVLDLLVDGDRAAVRFQVRGTHTSSFLGEEPSGRAITLDGTTVFHFADGHIAEDWEAMDEQQLRRQVSPAPN